MPTFIAVDLGASSGRVVNVRVDDAIELDVVHRFPTEAIVGPDGYLTWNIEALWRELTKGLVEAADRSAVESVALDSWGVDYGLIDADGRRVGPVHAYRSSRTAGVMEAVTGQVDRERIYGLTGIQFLPFNTLYQLVAARESPEYRAAAHLLMVPDLLNHALCGSTTNDITNASTTQLLDVSTRRWSDDLVEALGLRGDLLPALHTPGTELGTVTGIGAAVAGLRVVAAASHDTASAVAGTPLRADRPGIYISCGTWALVGCELPRPVTTADALAANVTNEVGVDGTVRLLKNVTGLWLLEECRRSWAAQGDAPSAAELVAAAEAVPGGRSVIDPDDPAFAPPGDMPARIAHRCLVTGQPVPASPAELTRTILDSLAARWRTTVATIERLSGVEATTIHLIGGGSAIPLLRRLCASACERPVLAGPAEATVVGNAVVQAVAAGVLEGVAQGRELVERTLGIDQIMPERTLDWNQIVGRLAEARASD